MATYAESVWQHSPGLADCVGQPWERVSLHSANSERVEQGVGRNAGINPDAFHATSGIDLLTEHLSGFLPSIWGQLPRVARLCRATLGCAAKPLRGKANVLLRRLLNVSRAFGVEREVGGRSLRVDCSDFRRRGRRRHIFEARRGCGAQSHRREQRLATPACRAAGHASSRHAAGAETEIEPALG